MREPSPFRRIHLATQCPDPESRHADLYFIAPAARALDGQRPGHASIQLDNIDAHRARVKRNRALRRVSLTVEQTNQHVPSIHQNSRNSNAPSGYRYQGAGVCAWLGNPVHQRRIERFVPSAVLFPEPCLVPCSGVGNDAVADLLNPFERALTPPEATFPAPSQHRSEEHTSELQSPCNLVCRLLL